MRKEKLLEEIREAIRTEEGAVPVYMAHLRALASRGGLGREEAQMARGEMRFLARESRRHREVMEDLLRKIQKEREDDL